MQLDVVENQLVISSPRIAPKSGSQKIHDQTPFEPESLHRRARWSELVDYMQKSLQGCLTTFSEREARFDAYLSRKMTNLTSVLAAQFRVSSAGKLDQAAILAVYLFSEQSGAMG